MRTCPKVTDKCVDGPATAPAIQWKRRLRSFGPPGLRSATLAIAPVQDVLNLGREARMNVPGHAVGNWRWRCPANIFSSPAFEWLQELTESPAEPVLQHVSSTNNLID